LISSIDSPDLLRTGVLCNPASGRVRKRINRIRHLVAQIPGVIYRETKNADETRAAITNFRTNKIDLLVIIGGDGTVQAILNLLFSEPCFPKRPLLSIIPAGSTNMTARDIGYRGNPERNLKKLASIIVRPADAVHVHRPVLRVEQGDDFVSHGMFFGTGIIASGSRYFQEKVKKTGLTGETASALVILRLLTALLLKRRTEDLKPARIRLKDDSSGIQDMSCLILFASTLNRLLLGMRPYWGQEVAPIRTTYIKTSPLNLWRSLLAIVTGRHEGLVIENGYYSRNNHTLELFLNGGFIIDGELFNSDSQNGPLKISTTEDINFLLP